MRTTTTNMRFFGALVGLGVLLVLVPDARPDDATDWANQQAQAQREREQAEKDRQDRENWANQQAQAQKERDEWYRQQAQAQKERDDWYAQQAQTQREAEQAARDRQERENWANQIAQNQKERDEWDRQQAQTQKEREDWDKWQAQAAKDAEWLKKDRELNDWYAQSWKANEEMMKWATDQANARQEAINRGEWGSPAAAQPAAARAVPPVAGWEMKPVMLPPTPRLAVARSAILQQNLPAVEPAPAPKLPVLPPPPPGADQPKTHTVTIYNGSQSSQTTFVMRDDGSWHATESHGINDATALVPVAAPQGGFPAQGSTSFNPTAFQQQVRQHQEQVRQHILQTRQQMMQRMRR